MTTQLRALVLSEGHTASSDYFIFPHLNSLNYDASLLNSRFLTFPDLTDYQLVVISRYLSAAHLAWLEKNAHQNLKIVYFMDDDLFDLRALAGLPWLYQRKIFTKALKHRPRLLKLCAEIWVSTPYLAEKYQQYQPFLLKAQALRIPEKNQKTVQVCYHGTASHQKEIAWLLPIINSVQARSEHIHFELFGTRAVAKAVYNIPRVSLLHPMSWPNYLSFTSVQKRDLALAPLLGGAFNAARGATKFYDYARLEAVGLYSDVPPYQGFIREGIDGFLLKNQPEMWVEKILQLADDSALRASMLMHIKQKSSEVH